MALTASFVLSVTTLLEGGDSLVLRARVTLLPSAPLGPSHSSHHASRTSRWVWNVALTAVRTSSNPCGVRRNASSLSSSLS
jgi:hypothetical protein